MGESICNFHNMSYKLSISECFKGTKYNFEFFNSLSLFWQFLKQTDRLPRGFNQYRTILAKLISMCIRYKYTQSHSITAS